MPGRAGAEMSIRDDYIINSKTVQQSKSIKEAIKCTEELRNILRTLNIPERFTVSLYDLKNWLKDNS
jgi:hypothetical protein